MIIPQVLTSSQCLACRGCCLFHQPDSDWSPRLMPEDVAALTRSAFDGAWRQGFEKIALKPCPAAHACSFLDVETHHCRVYASRPFECRLYPFLLSREEHGFKIYAHLSCPVVGNLKGTPEWGKALTAIREFFTRHDVQSFVERGAASYPDYSSSVQEVEDVFAFDPAGELWAHKPRVERALAQAPGLLSGMAFVNIFAWKDFFKFEFEDVDGALCVFAVQPAGMFMYWPPLGTDMSAGTIDHCFDRMMRANRGGSLTRVENVPASMLPLFDARKYAACQQGQEYIYRREDIARLKGRMYKTRRWDVNSFVCAQGETALWREYVPADFNGCTALLDRWIDGRMCRNDDQAYRHMLGENRDVHRLILAYAHRLGLVARVVEIDGGIAAYTCGYALNPDIFCVLFEVADLARKGLAAFVFNRFAMDDALAGYAWINAMDDFHMPELARAKMLWRPARLEPVYAITLKE